MSATVTLSLGRDDLRALAHALADHSERMREDLRHGAIADGLYTLGDALRWERAQRRLWAVLNDAYERAEVRS